MHTYTLTHAIKMNNDSDAFFFGLKTHKNMYTINLRNIITVLLSPHSHILVGFRSRVGLSMSISAVVSFIFLIFYCQVSPLPTTPLTPSLLPSRFTTFISYNGPFECVSVNKRREKSLLLCTHPCMFIPFSVHLLYVSASAFDLI